jgi:hypothetical protein
MSIKNRLIGFVLHLLLASSVVPCQAAMTAAQRYLMINSPALALTITTSPQNLYTSLCSGTVTVQANQSGAAANVGANVSVTLSGSTGVTFYSDANCTQVITNVTIASGTSSNNFYFIDTSTASAILTTSASGYSPFSQSETLTLNPYIWTGGAGSGNTDFETAANWSGGFAPSSNNIGIFDGTCGSNCHATISGDLSYSGIRATSAYTGTITVNSGVSTTVGSYFGGSTTVTILGGTLDASAATLLDTSLTYVAIGGTGTIKAPSGSGAWDIATLSVSGSGALNAGTGTINLSDIWNSAGITTTSALSVNNLNFGAGVTGDTSGIGFQFSGTITVAGDLTLDVVVPNGSYAVSYGGTLQVVGNIIQDAGWIRDNGSTTNIVWVGSGSKTFTQASGSYFPMNFSINGTGTLTFGTSASFIANFTYMAGTVVAPTTTYFMCPGYGTYTIMPGSMAFNSVSFGDGTNSYPGYSLNCVLNGTMAVGGNLIFNDYQYADGDTIAGGGTINVSGNLQFTKWIDNNSSLTIAVVGTSAQTITVGSNGSIPQGALTISGASSSVSLASAVNSGYTNWSLTAGTLYMSGYSLTVPSLTLSSTTVHKKNSAGTGSAGTLKVNGSTISNGSHFGGTIAN